MSLLRSALLLAILGSTLALAAETKKPNVLLVLLDDSGWTDFGCYGSQIETPRIDQAAAEGMRFTDCHSAAPNCSPSRVGLLTGRTPSRVGMYSYRPANHPMHLLGEETTLAEILKEQGYHTGHFGKWHCSTLLDPEQPDPRDQGFDYTLGTDNNAAPNHLNPVNFIRNGEPIEETEGYSCQVVVDECIQWLDSIEANKTADPFFACVWYHEPHTPIASPPELIEKYKTKYPDLSKKSAAYYANIENVDIATGRLLDKLKALEIDDDTLVFITSDNGGVHRFSNGNLRGSKSNVWEGGHRVPGIFRWPGKIAAGTTNATPISGVDFLPTICELASAESPAGTELDGVSLAGLLTGKTEMLERPKPLYWFFYRLNPSLALRDGKWSLIADTNDSQRPKSHGLTAEDMPFIKSSRPEKFLLFDLSQDIQQRNDVSADHPEVFERLKAKTLELHIDVVTEGPVWEVDTYKGGKAKVWDSY
ncbi:MAG: sulfatase [Verrucomicrobiota bacterium]